MWPQRPTTHWSRGVCSIHPLVASSKVIHHYPGAFLILSVCGGGVWCTNPSAIIDRLEQYHGIVSRAPPAGSPKCARPPITDAYHGLVAFLDELALGLHPSPWPASRIRNTCSARTNARAQASLLPWWAFQSKGTSVDCPRDALLDPICVAKAAAKVVIPIGQFRQMTLSSAALPLEVAGHGVPAFLHAFDTCLCRTSFRRSNASRVRRSPVICASNNDVGVCAHAALVLVRPAFERYFGCLGQTGPRAEDKLVARPGQHSQIIKRGDS